MSPFRMLVVALATVFFWSAPAAAEGDTTRETPAEAPTAGHSELAQRVKAKIDSTLEKAQSVWDGSAAQRWTLAAAHKTHQAQLLSAGYLTELGDWLEAKEVPGVARARKGSVFAWPGFIWEKSRGDEKAMGVMLGGSALVNYAGVMLGTIFPPLRVVTMIVTPAVWTFDALTLQLRQHYLREIRGKKLTPLQAITHFSPRKLNETRRELKAERHVYTAKRQEANRRFMRRWRVVQAKRQAAR